MIMKVIEKCIVGVWEVEFVDEFPFRERSTYYRETSHDGKWWKLEFGGRRFHGPWSGVVHTPRTLVYLAKDLAPNLSEIEVPLRARLEKVEKICETPTGVERFNHWIVTKPQGELTYRVVRVCAWHKHTLRGVGRDRNYRQYLEAEGAELLMQSHTSARTGRFWHECHLYTVPIGSELNIEGVGVP